MGRHLEEEGLKTPAVTRASAKLEVAHAAAGWRPCTAGAVWPGGPQRSRDVPPPVLPPGWPGACSLGPGAPASPSPKNKPRGRAEHGVCLPPGSSACVWPAYPFQSPALRPSVPQRPPPRALCPRGRLLSLPLSVACAGLTGGGGACVSNPPSLSRIGVGRLSKNQTYTKGHPVT